MSSFGMITPFSDSVSVSAGRTLSSSLELFVIGTYTLAFELTNGKSEDARELVVVGINEHVIAVSEYSNLSIVSSVDVGTL